MQMSVGMHKPTVAVSMLLAPGGTAVQEACHVLGRRDAGSRLHAVERDLGVLSLRVHVIPKAIPGPLKVTRWPKTLNMKRNSTLCYILLGSKYI